MLLQLDCTPEHMYLPLSCIADPSLHCKPVPLPRPLLLFWCRRKHLIEEHLSRQPQCGELSRRQWPMSQTMLTGAPLHVLNSRMTTIHQRVTMLLFEMSIWWLSI